MSRASALLLLPVLGCSDHELGTYNTPPSVTIITPEDGTTIAPGELIEFYGRAVDDQDSGEKLVITWNSSVDGLLSEDAADPSGDVWFSSASLTGDMTHSITLSATDSDGERTSASIAVEIGDPGKVGGAPQVIFAGPADGSQFLAGEEITFVGTITDEEEASEYLDVVLWSDTAGTIWSGAPEPSGVVSVVATDLAAAAHTVHLDATDANGNTGSDVIGIEVIGDGRPLVSMISPVDGSNHWTDAEVALEGEVFDVETDAELLALTWASDLQGELWAGNPSSDGRTQHGVFLAEGVHEITLSAVDEEAKTGSASALITVVDPLNHDWDGDGYTENEGDCDDNDSQVNPGAEELCDDIDNDCNGYINDDEWDSYEQNESSSTAYDLGEIDIDSDINSTFTSTTVSGLTLHHSGDEDWFTWDADDAFYDNANPSGVVTGLPTGGNFVLELYWNDGGWQLVDSDSGSSSLSVGYAGEQFNTDEDDWALRIYASSWPTGSCGKTFTLRAGS